jgi:hypothetical protein
LYLQKADSVLRFAFSCFACSVKEAGKGRKKRDLERTGQRIMTEFMNVEYQGEGETERDDPVSFHFDSQPAATASVALTGGEGGIDHTSSSPHHTSSAGPLIPSDGDLMLHCKDCNYQFIFTMGEQEFYNLKGFSGQPTRCKPCRAQKKLSRDHNSNGNNHHHNSQSNYQMGATMPYVMFDPYGVPYYSYPPQQHAPMKPCHAFMRGECMYGNECRYSHDTTSAYPAFNGYMPYAAIPPSSGFSTDPNYQANYHSQQPSRRLNKSKNPCFAFHRGGCSYGDTCRYTHDDSVTLPADFQFPPAQSQPRKHFCHAFQRGECTYGDSCRFIHEDSASSVSQPSSSS